MQFVYKPEGAEPKRWPFDADKLMSPEAEAIERHTKMTYGEWTDAVTRGSVLALHGLLYVLLKRSIPTLKWDEVQFNLTELDFELDDQETADTIAALEAKDELSAGEEQTLAQLREQVGPAAEATVPGEVVDPSSA
jgi:hypothetical protein